MPQNHPLRSRRSQRRIMSTARVSILPPLIVVQVIVLSFVKLSLA
jgi:hypothetical protein